MWLRVEHETRFAYDSPIREAYTELRLKPADAGGQRCSSFTLTTEPRGASIHEYTDRFGNSVQHFDVLAPHSALAVHVRSEVWTPERFEPPRAEPSLIDRWDFLHGTRYVSTEGEIGRLAASAAGEDGVVATAGRSQHLCAAVQVAGVQQTFDDGVSLGNVEFTHPVGE